jgi:hypothetical protein
MWGSLMLFTGLGSALGSAVFGELPYRIFAMMEGIAAGAMLTMIAETMLPEAALKGGAVTSVCTLLGLLAAIFFKPFE